MSDLGEASSMKGNNYIETPTDILKEMLRYSVFSEEALDVDSTRTILSELREREPNILRQTPEEALEVFRAEYSGKESEFVHCAFDEGAQTKTHLKDVKEDSYLSNGVVEVVHNKDAHKKNSHVKAHGKPRKQVHLLYRVAIAAVFIVLATLLFASTALGGNYFRSLVKWGRETFRFVDGSTPVYLNEGLVSLHDALDEFGITEKLAPHWIPDGFELVEFSVTDLPGLTSFVSYFEDGSKVLTVSIVSATDSFVVVYEKTGEDYSVYTRNGIEHHIMKNEGKLVIAWKNMDYECSVSGDINTREVNRIIDSIYEG